MSKTEDSIAEGVGDLLGPGETIISALVVSPRGSATAAAGLAAGEIGRRWSNKNTSAAAPPAKETTPPPHPPPTPGSCSRAAPVSF
jgi:hypothetical protein